MRTEENVLIDVSLSSLLHNKPVKKRYNVYLKEATVNLLREYGIGLSQAVQVLLDELVVKLAGADKLKVLLKIDEKLAKDLEYAARLRHKWDRPEWQQWWQKMAQKYKVKVSDLQRVATQLFGGEQR